MPEKNENVSNPNKEPNKQPDQAPDMAKENANQDDVGPNPNMPFPEPVVQPT